MTIRVWREGGSEIPMDTKTVFLSGPLTGIADYREKFAAAEARLKAAGYRVLNPSEIPSETEWGEAMKKCLDILDKADMLVSLPGWMDSPGAQIERIYAVRLGKTVMNLEEVLPNCGAACAAWREAV